MLDTHDTGKIALRSALHVKRPPPASSTGPPPSGRVSSLVGLDRIQNKNITKAGKKKSIGHMAFSSVSAHQVVGSHRNDWGLRGGTSFDKSSPHHAAHEVPESAFPCHASRSISDLHIVSSCVRDPTNFRQWRVSLLLTYFLRRGLVSVLGLQNQVYQISEFGGPEKTRAHAVTSSRVYHFCDQPLIVSPSAIVQMAVWVRREREGHQSPRGSAADRSKKIWVGKTRPA